MKENVLMFIIFIIFLLIGVQFFLDSRFRVLLNDYNNLKNNVDNSQNGFLIDFFQKKDENNNPLWIIIVSVLFFFFIVGKLILSP